MAKTLYRLTDKKMIGGVCAGLAEYLDIDLSVMRLIFIGLWLLTALFPLAVFYIIAWIVIPEAPSGS
ncbi:MAG: PspC domain-containing protein [Acidobacteria bacterium]|nr:PspC domain-containing protein [Acidobacteriota bacterium]MCG2817143.1 PspC domain-containing protein [Candidatus Aminicenantes bacterium]MBU1338584.1 PspC domain-containing protein [Acidobacteriota bacterium]MBU1475647.1 PspC domain-containing protein [Acidobacteriota bacterium]MBU2437990.1 PspC domain-containing protein [Acidobacteriota bacterium]